MKKTNNVVQCSFNLDVFWFVYLTLTEIYLGPKMPMNVNNKNNINNNNNNK